MQISLVNKRKAEILTFLYRGSEWKTQYILSVQILHMHMHSYQYCKCQTIKSTSQTTISMHNKNFYAMHK